MAGEAVMEDEFQGGRVGDHAGKTGLSDDAFLGGKLKILQPEKGYRAGIDAVLLAASIPASDGDTLFEAGIGTGVAAACLATRVPGTIITGVEIASRYALIAEENFKRNQLHERIMVLKGDLCDSMRHDQLDWPASGSVSHAYANPPFFEDHTVQAPADSLRAQAHMLKAGELENWVKVMTNAVKPRGTVSIIHPATSLLTLLAAMEPKLGALTVLPLRAHRKDAASRIIVRGTKGSKAPVRLLPGLVLHEAGSNKFVDEVDAVLRTGEALEFA
jgi:tRNA1(Val) A37 N6-methylase TrmN6